MQAENKALREQVADLEAELDEAENTIYDLRCELENELEIRDEYYRAKSPYEVCGVSKRDF
jgi:predicted nuclease with TOPRIM domain